MISWYLHTDYMHESMTDMMVQSDCAFYSIVFSSLFYLWYPMMNMLAVLKKINHLICVPE